jgi:hypothetical protein
MKGMLDFLEKAGLVTRDVSEATAPIDMTITPVAAPSVAPPEVAVASAAPVAQSAPAATGGTLNLDQIYAQAGIAPAIYPAERLLRLVDGLAAMDPGTRLMAIQAMDAADESWTIADPLQDAHSKLLALSAHGERLKADLEQVAVHTQAELERVATRQEQVVGEIRKQISELEALVAREMSRSAQETAEHQASLQTARDHTSSALAEMSQASARLQSLATQFGTTPPRQD